VDPDSFAHRYEVTLVPVIFHPWAQELLRQVPAFTGAHVLDLACGTGAVSEMLVRSGVVPASLTGIDITADMLAVARKKATEFGFPNTWIIGDAADLPFEDNRFDVAYCQQALQFFPDKLRALTELRRVLKPGGKAAFCVTQGLEKHPLLKAQAAALDRHVG
ncbi:methyltransferase domain-containing protein, partial [Escherichia coli]|nr:methyltransferase domain-containing protein [Escherichia coli]